jgi:hypothetical protein
LTSSTRIATGSSPSRSSTDHTGTNDILRKGSRQTKRKTGQKRLNEYLVENERNNSYSVSWRNGI